MANFDIAIVTPSCTRELYEHTSRLFPADLPHYVVDGNSGLFGLDFLSFIHQRLKNKRIKWLILMDEDIILTRPDSIYQLVYYMQAHNFGFCGMREGGVHSGRLHNPHVVNTFFSIINFEWTSTHWDKSEVLSHQQVSENEFEDNLDDLPFAWDDQSLFESYYCFYLWMRRNGHKGLFLSSSHIPDDPYTNILSDHLNREFLVHTWYARQYHKSSDQKIRIDHQLEKYNFPPSNTVKPVKLRSYTHKAGSILKKFRRGLSKM